MSTHTYISTTSRPKDGYCIMRTHTEYRTTSACKLGKDENWGKNRSDAAARDRWHGLPMTVRRAADAPKYLQIYPTTARDLQNFSSLTMGCMSPRKVPRAKQGHQSCACACRDSWLLQQLKGAFCDPEHRHATPARPAIAHAEPGARPGDHVFVQETWKRV